MDPRASSSIQSQTHPTTPDRWANLTQFVHFRLQVARQTRHQAMRPSRSDSAALADDDSVRKEQEKNMLVQETRNNSKSSLMRAAHAD
jgi:hypothetical protein